MNMATSNNEISEISEGITSTQFYGEDFDKIMKTTNINESSFPIGIPPIIESIFLYIIYVLNV